MTKVKLTAEERAADDFMKRWEQPSNDVHFDNSSNQTPETHNTTETPKADAPATDTSSVNSENQVKVSETSHDWEKRAKDGQRYIQELKDKLKEEEEAKVTLKKKLAEGSFGEKPKTAEEMRAFQDANPELFDYMTNMVREGTTGVRADLEAALEEERLMSARLVKQQKITQLKEIHPDASEIESSPEFLDWLDSQSSLTRQMVSSKDATVSDLASVIRNYKEAKGIIATPKSKKKAEQADAALGSGTNSAATPSSAKKIWTASEVSKLSDREFTKFESDIDAAVLEGRYVQDM